MKGSIILIAPLLTATTALGHFVGCFTKDVLENRQASQVLTDNSGCNAVCSALNTDFVFTYFWEDDDPNKTYCLCTNDPPNAYWLLGDCNSVDTVIVTVPCQRDHGFDLYGNCHLKEFAAVGTPVDSALACQDLCDSYPWAGVTYDTSSTPYQPLCHCYTTNTAPEFTAPPLSCYYNAFFPYFHNTQPSAVARRRLREKQAHQDGKGLCPHGMIACIVLDSNGLAYECLDVQEELESCGGCRHGEFSSSKSVNMTDKAGQE
ncbi:uncharacterized protein I303_103906 [Kwoniella dejecticola CBS 10117]|uniref:Apple domain-containing protein n=1 Tax=Kwoniella dejecticola CBS 10117 TaxID=1296121 RepID=A0A1A6A821_9TREE|nr:uncharacterized protein I303_03924 [Kwoniella dejecticola CBS 10117]OBR86204.1 hypothetical protein I303_03924 [Kwoniella dejecticola CBS 10117]